MPRVYVPNNSGSDYSDAERLGDIIFIMEGAQDRYNTDGFYKKCQEALAESEPNDFILITSLPIISAICSTIFGRMHGRVNYLLYRQGRYVIRTMELVT
jgi:hypothetical protein